MRIELNDISTIGHDLVRPECVLATAGGYLYTSDWRGGVCVIAPHGRQRMILARDADFKPQTNGIALLPNGDFLLCHLGAEDGGVFRLTADGGLSPFVTEVEGEPLPPTNYVHIDAKQRTWITVSTRTKPRDRAYRPDASNGFVVLADVTGTRIAADSLGFTNECCVSPDGRHLYVNETFTRKLSRFVIGSDGSLTNKATVAEFGSGTYPDGLTFDAKGGIWVTSIVSNRVIRITPNGEQTVVVEDAEPAHVQWVEDAYLSHTMGRPHLDKARGKKLRNISSLAFGGNDMKTAYLGCLLDDKVYTFSSPVAGWKPPHWDFPNPAL